METGSVEDRPQCGRPLSTAPQHQRRRKQIKSDQAMGVVYNGRGINIKLCIDYN